MLTADKFKRVGYTKEEAERIDRPTISYWQDAWRRLKKIQLQWHHLSCLD